MASKAETKPRYGVPDEDTPELTPEVLARARKLPDILRDLGLPPIGRPRLRVTKTPVNLRLDPEIVAHFKAGGAGWQTRINDVLGKHVKAASRKKSA